MLKKITFIAVVTVLLSAVSFTGYAQVSVSGSVSAEATVLDSTTVGDADALGSSSFVNGGASISFSYSQDILYGWTSTVGYGLSFGDGRPGDETIAVNRTGFSVGADGNFYVKLENEMVAIVLGDTKYLGGVASTGGWESANAEGYSATDAGDLSSRNGAIGVEIKSIPDVTVKFGGGLHSKDVAELTAHNGTDEIKLSLSDSDHSDSYLEWGGLAKYSANGLSVGAEYVSKTASSAVLRDNNKATVRVEVAENVTTKLLVGGSYELDSQFDIPLTLWAVYKMEEDVNTTQDSDGNVVLNEEDVLIDELESLDSHTTIGLGAKYSFGAGNVGVSYDMATYTDVDHDETDGISVVDPATSNNLILWLNYDLSDSTLAYASFSNTATTDRLTDDDTDEYAGTEETHSVVYVGVTQSF